MLSSQERVSLAIQRKEADRVPVFDQPWKKTVERWHREGLPEDQTPGEYFRWDMRCFTFDNTLQLESTVLEETDDYVINTDKNGTMWKRDKRTWGVGILGYTITTRDDWEEHKPRMTWNETRVDWSTEGKKYEQARSQGLYCCPLFVTGFTRLCNMLGPERAMIAMVEDPEWVRDILMTEGQLTVVVIEEMFARGFDFDGIWWGDDLGYKHRAFFSRRMYRELLMPAHKLICDCTMSRGKQVLLHSDGNVNELLPLLIEIGVECLQPVDVKAGMDLLKLKKEYGDRLALFGGIDARAMADPDPAVIEHEIATKVPVAKKGGGYLFHSDHSVPDKVSFQRFSRIMELAREYGSFC